jgi:secondary thiamine-phosphate synthase enzyme
MIRRTLALPPTRRGLHDITTEVSAVVAASGVRVGLCHVFVQHTSASLTIQENADPDVLVDLEGWFARAVPDGDPRYRHRDEGPDDMSAHIRSALTQTSLWVPIDDGRLALGTWQGLYLYEHRTAPHQRRIVISILD